MKTTTTLTIEIDTLAKAKKEIENLSAEFEAFLNMKLDLKVNKGKKERLQLAEIKITELSQALNKETEYRKRLEIENKRLIGKIEELKRRSNVNLSGFQPINI